ncbi:hypothetical protein CGBL_0129390 [Corynebacterium glutamicum]|nr:hypothetical protein CGBL_0129390 [Corynebacterium glutamicum]
MRTQSTPETPTNPARFRPHDARPLSALRRASPHTCGTRRTGFTEPSREGQFVLHKHLADWGCTDQWSRALGAGSSTQEETMQARWSINITPIERGARIVLGLLGVVGGGILLSQADSTGAVIVELLLIVAGLDLIVTGGTGHCPLYKKLGRRPLRKGHPS